MESVIQKLLPFQANFASIIYVFHQHFRYEVCGNVDECTDDDCRGKALLPHICNISDFRRHEGDISRVSHEDVFLAFWLSSWRQPHNATKRPSVVLSSMGSRWCRISLPRNAAIGWQLTAARRSSAPSTGTVTGAALAFTFIRRRTHLKV